MTQQSLGLIETAGLTAAITAADAAVKSANVRLVGYELAKGGGLATVKVCGDVGAVKAAVAAAVATVSGIGRVAASTVIARPAPGMGVMITSKETVGAHAAKMPISLPITEVAAATPSLPSPDEGAISAEETVPEPEEPVQEPVADETPLPPQVASEPEKPIPVRKAGKKGKR